MEKRTSFTIPTTKPTNTNGCKYFLGWSSNKNAASAQYTAGQKGIEFKTDTTLYAVWENHHDGNGDMICDLCQTALSAPTTVNGIYQISNKNQLIWFMQYVNAGNKSASAVLTADIDMGGYNWTPIASTASYHESGAVVTDKGYTGTFDGAGHVIKNFTVTGGAGDGSSSASGNVKSYGLFGTVSGTVKNLGIDGFTFNVGTADCRAGAIVGQLVTGGRIEDCYVINSKVLTGSRIAGAIAGCNYGGTIDSCFAYNCEVTGHARCAAVVGDTKDDGGGKIGTVTNCYADKNPVGSQNGGSSYVTNCATLTAGQISSGEAAWMLNGNSSDGVWKQTVGSGLPSFVGGTVYQVLRCDGKTIIYSNSSANPQAHTYSNINGLCTFCGAENPNVVASVFKRGSIIGVYTRLETAISMVERSVVADMAVVQLQKNVDLGGAYQKIDGGVFTIDLNGYEISNNSRTRETLSIAGSGTDITIISSRTGGTVKNGSGNAIMGESSTNLTVTGIRVIAAQNGMRLYGNATLRDLTVESMNAEGYGISVQGADLTLTLTNCTVTAAKAALYITGSSSTVIVNGGSFNGDSADFINLGKVVLGEGTIFPGGISVDYTTLKAILGEGMAYWQGDKMIIPAEDATQITGGDVVIKAECMHPGDKTYTNNVGDHSWSCEDCNNTFTEAHSYTNCVCVCGAVSPDAEASVTIGGKASYYATLNDAIAVAQNCSAADQAVVTILKDIDLGDDYQRINGGVFTFDLNGFELSSLEDYWGVFVLRNGADITIIDSRGDGKITGVFYGIEAHDSTVTISGGTISGQDCGVYVTGCTVTISGGTISGQTYGVYAYNNSDVTISGGTIIGKGYDLRAYKSSVFKLTVGENGVGATFPGGIKVYGTTLNAILGEGAAYWQGNQMIVPAEGATEITGGDVVIKAPCTHSDDSIYFERYSNEFHQKTCSCGFINELEEHRFGSDFVCDVCGYDKNVITITMTDDWGDGWNGNGIYVYKDGVLIGTATIMTGRTDTWSCPYDPDAEYEFYWQRGGYPEECSFEISIAGETVKKVASRGCSNYREGQLLYPLPLYSGWTELDGKWYYYDLESHEPVTGVVRVPYPTAPINGITYGPNPEDVAYFEGKGQTFVNKDTGWFWFNYDGSFNYYQNGVWHHDVGNHSGSVLVVNGMIPWHVGMVAALGGYYYFIGDETNGANKYAVGDVYITRNTTDRDFVIGGVYTFDEYGALCEYNGITEVNGVLRYYEDARLMLGNGLTKVGENYIYVRSNGELVVDAEYYILPNDLGIAPGTYTFDENGFMVEPISSEKNGVYFENGSWYYYENGKIGYNKGLIHVSTNWHFEDGSVMGYTAFIYVRSSGKLQPVIITLPMSAMATACLALARRSTSAKMAWLPHPRTASMRSTVSCTTSSTTRSSTMPVWWSIMAAGSMSAPMVRWPPASIGSPIRVAPWKLDTTSSVMTAT